MVRRPRGAACLLLVALAALAAAGPAGAERIRPRVVGGTSVAITEHPWQVALLVSVGDVDQPPDGDDDHVQFCGGVILDATHVVTAAHCSDLGSGPLAPAELRVLAGNANWPVVSPDEQYVEVSAISPIAAWVPDFDNDAAILTLAQPLTFDAPNVQPAVLTPPAPQGTVAAGTPLTVSGWGFTSPGGDPSEVLQATQVRAIGDAQCADFFDPGDITAAVMLCAVEGGRDACSGDSGGPLTRLDGTLVGLVSFGPFPCADPTGVPGVYTELADPTINAQVRFPGYDPPALADGSQVQLTGTPRVGETLTCLGGGWTDAPAFDYRFEDTTGALLRDWDPEPTFSPGTTALGRGVACLTRARAASGAAAARSAPSVPVTVAPPPPPAPAPAPVPRPAPAPAPVPPAAPAPTAAPRDTVAPVARIVSLRCRRGACTLRVGTSDRGGSGVAQVVMTLRPAGARRRTAKRRVRRDGTVTVTFRRIPRGRVRASARAIDAAGNRQRFAARTARRLR